MSHSSSSPANPRRRRYLVLALGLALLQAFLFASVWATLMARGDHIGPGAPLPRMPWLERMQAVLMAPLFYLIPERLELSLVQRGGNDTLLLSLEAALNAGLWGTAIAAVIYRLRGKR